MTRSPIQTIWPSVISGEANVTMDNVTFNVCFFYSCFKRCDVETDRSMKYDSFCRCDELCPLTHDCCVDYFLQCRNISDFRTIVHVINDTVAAAATDRDDVSSGGLRLDYLIWKHSECVDVGDTFVTMVTSCPQDADSEVKGGCADVRTTSPVSHATEPKLVFRNAACATCHGVKNVVTWTSRLQCEVSVKNSSLDGVLTAFRDGRCWLLHHPPGTHASVRRCSSLQDLPKIPYFVDKPTCRQQATTGCSDDVKVLCSGYQLPTILVSDSVANSNSNDDDSQCSDHLTEFRNPHCMQCHTGLKVTTVGLSCSLHASEVYNVLATQDGKSGGILALFDLSPDRSGFTVNGEFVPWPGFYCAEDEVYDVSSQLCRRLQCPPGHVLRDKRCVVAAVDGASQLLGHVTPTALFARFNTRLPCDVTKFDYVLPNLVNVSCSNDTQATLLYDVFQGQAFTQLLEMLVTMLSSLNQPYVTWLNPWPVVATVSNTEQFPSDHLLCPDGNTPVIDHNVTMTNRQDGTYVVSTLLGFDQVYPIQAVPFRLTFYLHHTGGNVDDDHDKATEAEDAGQGRQRAGGAGNREEEDSNGDDEDEESNDEHLKEDDRNAGPVTYITPASDSNVFWGNFFFMPTDVKVYKAIESKAGVGVSEGAHTVTATLTSRSADAVTVHDALPVSYSVTAVLCVPRPPDCTTVAFPVNDTRLDNGSLVIVATGVVFQAKQFQVHGGQVFVCSTTFHNLNDAWRDWDLFRFITNEQWIAMTTFTVLSVMTLTLVLVVYTLLPELRTLPGMITCCLVASLLVGHVTLQLNFSRDEACRVIGATSHLAWLSAFAWMTALAVNMASTFFAPSASRKSKDQSNRSFRRYCVVCYGLPAMIVCPCLALDWIPVSETGFTFRADYGQASCGWLGNSRAVLCLFFVPVALSILTNLLAFLAAVVGIEKTTRASRLATSSSKSTSSSGKDRRRLLLYAKMSAALGFTWVLGLVQAFARWPWLTWVYLVLNSLQGALIALAFLANERVLQMLRHKVLRTRGFMGNGADRKPRGNSTTLSTMTATSAT